MKKRFLIIFLIIFVPIVSLIIIPCFANDVMPWNKASTIETAFSWGDLAEIPEAATEINVEQKGSAFSREFIVSFKCPATDIKSWMLKSPGIQNAFSKEVESGKTIYFVPGKNGSIGGKVTIDTNTQKVIADMSWS